MGKKQLKNQLPLDFSSRGDRIVLHLGQVPSQQAAEQLFEGLVQGRWMLEPAGEVADISSAQVIVRHMGHKLPYPETIKIAQLHDVEASFTGFSAIYRQKGWIFINARSEANERCYQTYLLAASLGLYPSYSSAEALAARAEHLVFETLLPAKDVQSFFYEGITKIPAFLAADIADFFKVPFPMVLKRALQLGIVSDEQYRNFMTVTPIASTKPSELFITQEGSMEDLESQLFGQDEDF
ncbi:hypothetical protein GCM10027275_23810 [Rhabdobacter roseus]|uniref:Uncharacterized protein n=1 Tax=Rhabdobacter roseus TaxID=1655419 RepID=A0A840TL95_9BACT|nr:hypothetical protein [Rhabdobacter roseus]MBB5284321.1 hypothetical protein [Rhabdobacter roseus]